MAKKKLKERKVDPERIIKSRRFVSIGDDNEIVFTIVKREEPEGKVEK